MTINCTPIQDACCSDFCVEVILVSDQNEEGCFSMELQFLQHCIGDYIFVLDDCGTLNNVIEQNDGFKMINLTVCGGFEGLEISNFMFKGTFFTENCGEIQVGPAEVFGSDPGPVCVDEIVMD